jgi:hypothetical protein
MSAAATLVAVLAATFTVASPAHANAETGVCASGKKLGSYSYNEPAYNSAGELMWRISWKKRWCYDTAAKAVASVYTPKPTISIYSYFDAAWRVGSMQYVNNGYSSVGPNGNNHPN